MPIRPRPYKNMPYRGVKGNVSIWFTGIDEFLEQFEKDQRYDILSHLDKSLPEYAEQLAKDMGDRAPVLTGKLQQSLYDSPKRIGFLHFQLWTAKDVPYAYRQDREHPSKSGFIKIPRNKARDDFPEWVKRKVDEKL